LPVPTGTVSVEEAERQAPHVRSRGKRAAPVGFLPPLHNAWINMQRLIAFLSAIDTTRLPS
jgi:hypothetical protein